MRPLQLCLLLLCLLVLAVQLEAQQPSLRATAMADSAASAYRLLKKQQQEEHQEEEDDKNRRKKVRQIKEKNRRKDKEQDKDEAVEEDKKEEEEKQESNKEEENGGEEAVEDAQEDVRSDAKEATTTTTEQEDNTKSSPVNLLAGAAKNLTANLNATAITLSACEQIELTVSFLTSLDFDQHFWHLVNFTQDPTTTSASSRYLQFGAIGKVYLLPIILTPISLAMAFCGASLLHPTCCLAAAAIGVFLVFHLVEFLARSNSVLVKSITQNIDCSMKLALSFISASVSAMLASTFLRFGLFSLGALAAGGGSYLIFDAFPFLDPTRQAIEYEEVVTLHGQLDSELSPFGWVITTLVAVCGGLFLRWYEQASLEIVTAAMGGLGCAYSIHTLVVLQGGQLNRSLVFLIANGMAYSGWRVQRHRRLYKSEYAHKKTEDQVPLISAQPQPQQSAPAATPQTTASWEQMQSSLHGLLQQRTNATSNTSGTQALPSEEQIVELTKSLNTLLNRMESTTKESEGDSKKT